MRLRFRFLALLFVLLGITGCADRATGPYPVSVPQPPTVSAMGPGDLFDVRVYGEPTLSSSYEVDSNGNINFPLIGAIKAEGRSPPEIEKDIETRLADGYIKNPSVSVKVTEYRSRRVSVFGQVRSPGTFGFTENMSVVEAITKAGGFTGMAKKNAVRITRVTGEQTERIVVAVEDIGTGRSPNFLLRPGDVVFVPERLF